MPIIFDIFGVVFTDKIDQNLVNMIDVFRQKNERVYLASNVDEKKAHILMHEMGLKSHVDELFCSGSIGVSKPHQGFYDHVTTAIHALPHEIIFFDDTISNVTAAENYGWHAFPYIGAHDTKGKIEQFLKMKATH